jgi:hypothetical protein
MRRFRRDRDRVALAQDDLAILLAVHPRLRDAVEDVEDLHVRVRVHGRRIAGLGRLDAGTHGRRALVVTDDGLIDGVRPELHDLAVVETLHDQVGHGGPPIVSIARVP